MKNYTSKYDLVKIALDASITNKQASLTQGRPGCSVHHMGADSKSSICSEQIKDAKKWNYLAFYAANRSKLFNVLKHKIDELLGTLNCKHS